MAQNMRKYALRWLKTVSSSFQATLNIREVKVALNPMYRIYLNFAKSYILSCLSKFYNKKKFHRAVFEI